MRISDWSSDVCSSDLSLMFGQLASSHTVTSRFSRSLALRFCTALPDGSRTRIQLGLRSTGALASNRSEEHTSELQSLMRISYAVFCLKKKTKIQSKHIIDTIILKYKHTHNTIKTYYNNTT